MSKLTLVKNITTGPKGIRSKAAGVVMIEPGKSAEVDLADGEDEGEWFKFGDAKSEEPGPLDQSVEKLAAYLDGVNDADEVQKLIEAETAGKSRQGALAALEARKDAILAA